MNYAPMKMTGLIKNNGTEQNRKSLNTAALLQFTILFCILVLVIYWVFIINHKSFIKTGDGIKQGYFMTVELKHQMEMLFAGKGLQLWSWSKLLGMSVQTNRYWDPFNWLAAAFPVGYIELGYTIAALLRFYCGGVAFLAMLRYMGRSVFSAVFGAAVYTFTGYTIVTGMIYPDLLMNIYLFPLLVISVEMIYRGKSPAFFSIMTGVYLVSNFYYSYMAAISIILYILFRYFAYRQFDLKDYAATIGRFMIYGIIGLCIGGIQFIPDFASLSEASTESVTDESGLFYDMSHYINIGKFLIGTGGTKPPAIIGWTFIIIIFAAIALIGIRLSKTPAVLSLLMLAGAMTPAVSSVYNGFGYPSLRWVFALQLFAVWALAEEIDKARMYSRAGIVTAAAALIFTSVVTLGFTYIFHLDPGRRAVTFMMLQLLGDASMVLLLVFIRKEGCLKRLSRVMMVVILVATLGSAWTVSFLDTKGKYYRNNKINKLLEQSTQRAGALIEDEGFYRLDQVDSVLYRHRVKPPANETMWWQTRSIYAYNSRTPSVLLEFNRLLGNNYGYSKRVAVVSNDNRTGLDYLYGVKYFLGDDLKYDKTGSDEYAGYGFRKSTSLDGVNVFKSKYDVSLGYVFDKYISKSEFEKLGYGEREQAILQAVVLPDDKDISSVSKVKSSDIHTAVQDVGYTVVESDGAALSDGNIVVDRAGRSITLALEPVENSQLLLSMTGLLRNVSKGQSQPFELHVRNEHIEEIATNDLSNQTIPDIRDYNLNLGYFDHYSDGRVQISFTEPGTYRYDEIKIKAQDADLFDTYIEDLSENRYVISSFSDRRVEGTIDSAKGGILYLSIIEPERWECYIDGKKTDIISNTDIAFTGVAVPAGHHSITLKFRNRASELGAMMSIIGLALLAATCLIRRKKWISN